MREALNVICLALSMFCGLALTLVSLAIRPSYAEISSLRLIFGAAAGAFVWLVGRRLIRNIKSQPAKASRYRMLLILLLLLTPTLILVGPILLWFYWVDYLGLPGPHELGIY